MQLRHLVPVVVIACSAELAASDVGDFQAQGIEFLARVSPTEFDALNPTTQPVLLRFTSPDTGATATTIVPGLAEVQFQFPAGSASTLLLEVTSVVDGVATTTAAVALSALEDPTVDAMWVQRLDSDLHSFAQLGESFESIDPTTSGGTECSSSGSHVPEVSPILLPPPELPKKIEPWVPPA